MGDRRLAAKYIAAPTPITPNELQITIAAMLPLDIELPVDRGAACCGGQVGDCDGDGSSCGALVYSGPSGRLDGPTVGRSVSRRAKGGEKIEAGAVDGDELGPCLHSVTESRKMN
jgi:hypothetical protein